MFFFFFFFWEIFTFLQSLQASDFTKKQKIWPATQASFQILQRVSDQLFSSSEKYSIDTVIVTFRAFLGSLGNLEPMTIKHVCQVLQSLQRSKDITTILGGAISLCCLCPCFFTFEETKKKYLGLKSSYFRIFNIRGRPKVFRKKQQYNQLYPIEYPIE